MWEKAENVEEFIPRIGEFVPDFEAVTSHGVIRLSNYKGKWVILFSHPADFTPVCTTEFIAFAKLYEEFKKRNVELIGLSIDSVYSHIAWVKAIEEKFDVKIPFPIIADLDMKIAKLFNMIHPKASATAAVRCLYVIDPEMKLRASMCYPMEAGRNIEEILRLIDALQTADRYKVATPANWKPGDPVIVPPPRTWEDAEKRLEEGYECVDWYFCKKKLG
ncbi:MAG: peroxiredoxin [Thermoprotei archaeon]|nr:peroxiredoxin [Thermoprotei archaeon]